MGSFFPRRTDHLDFHTGPDVPEVACDTEPRTATLEPAGTALPLAWADGVARTTVTVLDGHAMIVLRS